MFRSKKTRLAALITAGALTFSASPALAQVTNPVQFNTGNVVSALNNLNVQITEVRVVNVEDSVNNNTVNVNALQNFLNRNNVDVDIRNVLNNLDVDILNNNTVNVGIDIQGTTLVLFV